MKTKRTSPYRQTLPTLSAPMKNQSFSKIRPCPAYCSLVWPFLSCADNCVASGGITNKRVSLSAIAIWIKTSSPNSPASIKSFIRKLPSFVGQKSDTEFWLKDPESKHAWEYGIRLFLNAHLPEWGSERNAQETMLVEVNSHSQAFSRDVKALFSAIAHEAQTELVDDDGEVVNLLKNNN